MQPWAAKGHRQHSALSKGGGCADQVTAGNLTKNKSKIGMHAGTHTHSYKHAHASAHTHSITHHTYAHARACTHVRAHTHTHTHAHICRSPLSSSPLLAVRSAPAFGTSGQGPTCSVQPGCTAASPAPLPTAHGTGSGSTRKGVWWTALQPPHALHTVVTARSPRMGM